MGNKGDSMDYVIITDMSIDIDRDYANAHGLKYIPMEYVVGNDTYQCNEPENDEMMHNYYEKLRQKVETHTSQIVPNNYVEFFTPFVEQGLGILYLALSSGLSDTFSSANVAVGMIKEDFPDAQIEIVDSYCATGGMGILIESAYTNKENGMDLASNAAWMREHALNINLWFRVEDLMYLKRGGRVSAATAIVGTALNIKPILSIDVNGKLGTIDKKRGSKQASKALADLLDANLDDSIGDVVYVCCADCIEEANRVKDMILEKHPNLKVRVTMLSPIIGAHTGPDMIAVIHYGTKRTTSLTD